MTDEQLRHECEVRWLLRLFVAEGKEGVDRYIALVTKHRGQACADRLLADVRAQHELGNRGERGDWRERMREAA
jgi:hypothetical protein